MKIRKWVRNQTFLSNAIQHVRTIRTRQTMPLGRIPDLPHRVIVEPTNACNLKCAFCGNKDMLRPWTYLAMDVYEKLIREMEELGIPRLTLHTVGESTLHPELPEMIRIAKHAGLIVTLSTNGTLVDEELARKIITAGPDILNVSVDAADPEKFKLIREGVDPDAVYQCIQHFKTIRDQEGPVSPSPWGEVRLPTLVATCVITEHFTPDEEKAYFAKYGPFVDDFLFHWPNNHANYVPEQPHRRGSLIPNGLRDWAYKKVRYSCPYPWDALFLLSDLTMSVCRFDFDARVKVGRYGEQTLPELWHGDAMNSLRRAHMNFDFKDWSTCEDCSAVWYENRHEDYTKTQNLKKRNNWDAARNTWLSIDPMKKHESVGSGTVESDVGF